MGSAVSGLAIAHLIFDCLTRTSGPGGIWLADNTDPDFDLWFSYYNEDTSSASYGPRVWLRSSGSDYIALYIKGDSLMLQQMYDSNYSNLDWDGADTEEDTWYDVYVRCDGADIDVYRAERDSGDELELLLTTDNAQVTATPNTYLLPTTDAQIRHDNIRLASADLSTTATYAYDNANELLTMVTGKTGTSDATTTFTYDDWGRTITKTQDSLNAVYKYRFGHKLKTVDTDFPDEADTETLYDGLGKLRVVQVDSGDVTWMRWDTGWNLLGVYADDVGEFWDIGDVSAEMVHGPGGVLALDVVPSSNVYLHYYKDHLGSTRRTRLADRSSVSSYEYTPYGAIYHQSGDDYLFKYTGHIWAADIGLYYAPYRFYNPQTARWLTRDPMGMVDGPNVYAYVRGDPVTHYDALGLHCCLDKKTGKVKRCWLWKGPDCPARPACRRKRTTPPGRGGLDCQQCCDNKYEKSADRIKSPLVADAIRKCCFLLCSADGAKATGKSGASSWRLCKKHKDYW